MAGDGLEDLLRALGGKGGHRLELPRPGALMRDLGGAQPVDETPRDGVLAGNPLQPVDALQEFLARTGRLAQERRVPGEQVSAQHRALALERGAQPAQTLEETVVLDPRLLEALRAPELDDGKPGDEEDEERREREAGDETPPQPARAAGFQWISFHQRNRLDRVPGLRQRAGCATGPVRRRCPRPRRPDARRCIRPAGGRTRASGGR